MRCTQDHVSTTRSRRWVGSALKSEEFPSNPCSILGDFFSGCIVQGISGIHVNSDGFPWKNPQKSIIIRVFRFQRHVEGGRLVVGWVGKGHLPPSQGNHLGGKSLKNREKTPSPVQHPKAVETRRKIANLCFFDWEYFGGISAPSLGCGH